MSTSLAALWLIAGAPVFDACRIGNPAAGPRMAAECTTLSVPENPDDAEGRQITLKVARLKAMTGDPAPNPLVFIAGGPGQSALESFPGVSQAFNAIRRQRDILLVDQRGTGGSNPLNCAALEENADAARDVDADAVREAASQCVASLDADLRHYTTLDAVRDLETLRVALGEEAFALYGISYGTRVALEYLRRHPEHVEAAILDGVTVPGEALGPQIASDAQRALDLMFDRCAQSDVCAERFPRLRERFAALRARLERAPASVDVRDPFTGGMRAVSLSWPRVAMVLRMYSYAPESVSLLPLLLAHAEAGDWQALAGNVLALERQSESMLYIGMHNSVVCSEDAPYFSAAAAQPEGATPYLGTLTTDLVAAMCAAWPSRELPADFREPVTSDLPVLLLSGEADPVTPPQNGAEVARHLSNALHLVAPGQGHGVAWRGCTPRLMAEFLESAVAGEDVAGLDAACIEELSASPFFIDRNGPMP